jgi:hyperosmotically inducible periplasmic protein
VTVTTIVDASKLFLVALSLGLSVAACSRSTSTPDQAESGAAAPPAGAVNTIGSAASMSSGPGGSDSSIGSRIDDSVITTKVKAMLTANDDIKGSDISVETRNGAVVLSGFVDSAEQGEKAVGAVRNVDGVKSVGSKLAVRKPQE